MIEDTLGAAVSAAFHVAAGAVGAVTGWDISDDEADTVGLRIVNLTRAYNFRCGHKRELEAPSPRYGSAPVDGPAKGKSILPELEGMLDRYYEQMGWSKETGKPLPDTLRRLGLKHVIKDIW
jgi:aldehyde:ferredoxin oxidoreductase